MGGETCGANPPRSSCPTAMSEMSLFHWSYLNTDYHPDVINGWNSGGCLPEITRRLGYRFALQTGTYPSTATHGGALPVRLTIRNDGWAAPFNPRGVALVLRNTATSAVYRFPLNANPRLWLAGATATIDQSVTLPAGMPAGTYALLLDLPDPQLSSRPEYSIRLANENVWEAATGFNNLRHSVTVN